MGFDVSISTVLCEECRWIMLVYDCGDFYCPNNACPRLFQPYELRLQMHRKELHAH